MKGLSKLKMLRKLKGLKMLHKLKPTFILRAAKELATNPECGIGIP